jgi:GNAT superfamily N-acetyltransferase
MPDRAHSWRGIHDPEMVRAAVAVALVSQEAAADGIRASLVVLNRDVGHAFPTYVTPRVFLATWQESADGTELAGTRQSAEIGRQVDFDQQPWREVFDTRLLPGESAALAYDRPRAAEAVALVGRVTVDPDYHYRGVYAQLLKQYSDPDARRLIAEAAQIADDSRYVLAEHRLELGAEPGSSALRAP